GQPHPRAQWQREQVGQASRHEERALAALADTGEQLGDALVPRGDVDHRSPRKEASPYHTAALNFDPGLAITDSPMSRAYRISITESLRRHVQVEDGIRTTLEVLPVLAKERMGALPGAELEKRGFKREGDKVRRPE